MRARALQFRFRLDPLRRCHAVCAWSVARSATVSCQPPASDSAQNTAASLTRARSWVRRDGVGGCAGEANAVRAECPDTGLVLEGGLRRALPEPRREEAAGRRLGVADLNHCTEP